MLAAACAATAALSACAEDGPGSLQVGVRADRSTLAADGSESATLLLSLFYDDGTAGPLGSTVTVLCFDTAQQAFGHLGGSSTIGVGTAQVDELGLADLSFRCSGEAGDEQTAVCLARFEGSSASSSPIACAP
jgi:hypothetical protein